MSLFAISDLHLSTDKQTDKSMEVFGRRWDDYMNRIKRNWERLITPEDTVVIPGDISWGLSLEEAVSDLKFIDALPGRKILGKGNHDFWWTTMRKHSELFQREGITTIDFLFNNAQKAGRFAIAGSRGWYHDEDAKNQPDNANFDKLTAREALRLRTSLKAASELISSGECEELAVFTHFPPFWNGKASESLIDVLNEFEVKRLYFGHIHGNYTLAPSFEYGGIEMVMISADFLDFTPKFIGS